MKRFVSFVFYYFFIVGLSIAQSDNSKEILTEYNKYVNHELCTMPKKLYRLAKKEYKNFDKDKFIFWSQKNSDSFLISYIDESSIVRSQKFVIVNHESNKFYIKKIFDSNCYSEDYFFFSSHLLDEKCSFLELNVTIQE